MGALLSCCKGAPAVKKEDQREMIEAQRKAGLAAQQRQSPMKVETEEDRAKASEAKFRAGLAAQKRAEAFEKSSAGKAARKVAAELAKPLPPPNQRREPMLRWQMG